MKNLTTILLICFFIPSIFGMDRRKHQRDTNIPDGSNPPKRKSTEDETGAADPTPPSNSQGETIGFNTGFEDYQGQGLAEIFGTNPWPSQQSSQPLYSNEYARTEEANTGFESYQGLEEMFRTNQQLSQEPSQSINSPQFIRTGDATGSNPENVFENIQANESTLNNPMLGQYPTEQFYGRSVQPYSQPFSPFSQPGTPSNIFQEFPDIHQHHQQPPQSPFVDFNVINAWYDANVGRDATASLQGEKQTTDPSTQQTKITLKGSKKERCEEMIRILGYTTSQMLIEKVSNKNVKCICFLCKKPFVPQNENDIETHVNSQPHIDALKTIKFIPQPKQAKTITKKQTKSKKIQTEKTSPPKKETISTTNKQKIDKKIKELKYTPSQLHVYPARHGSHNYLCDCNICRRYNNSGLRFPVSNADAIEQHVNSETHKAALQDEINKLNKKFQPNSSSHVDQITESTEHNIDHWGSLSSQLQGTLYGQAFGTGTEEYGGFDPQTIQQYQHGIEHFQPQDMTEEELMQRALNESSGGFSQRNLYISGDGKGSHGQGGSRDRGSDPHRGKHGQGSSDKKDPKGKGKKPV